MSSNMTATEEAHWVAMAQSGQLRMHLKEVVRPGSPGGAPSDKKIPESQVGTATYSAESGSNPDVPGIKKGLGLGVPVVRKPGARGVRANADQAPAHPHHCSVAECCEPVYRSEICKIHRRRLARTGSVESIKKNHELRWAQSFDTSGEGCWEWTGPRDPSGGNYGLFQANGVTKGAHRVAWERANGPIPDGMFICHRCDNPPCVRLDHLFMGTPLDNMRDMIAKGRAKPPQGEANGMRKHPEAHMRGYTHHWTKLTPEDVVDVRRRLALGETHQSIADAHGVHYNTISRINRGLTYSVDNCIHRWRLDEPNGPVTHGRCKACGMEREFSTAGPDVMPLTLLSKSNLAKRGLATRFKKVAG